jgi:hypothetical protein
VHVPEPGGTLGLRCGCRSSKPGSRCHPQRDPLPEHLAYRAFRALEEIQAALAQRDADREALADLEREVARLVETVLVEARVQDPRRVDTAVAYS